MPHGPIPDDLVDLLAGNALGHLATLDREGRPHVNPVWFLWDGERLLLSIKPETVKYRNLRRDPHATLCISDPDRPARYLELRGTASEFKLYEDLTFVNVLARKYTGADFTSGKVGEHRYRVTIEVESWTAQRG